MSRYSRWGFFKNKRNAGTLANVDNFYPKYPDLPSSDIFYTFIRDGYIRRSDPVANVNTTLGAPLKTGVTRLLKDMQYTMPDGSIALPTYNDSTSSAELFKYDPDAGNITQTSPTVGTGVDAIISSAVTGCLVYNGNVHLYIDQGNTNVDYIRFKTDYSAINKVNTHSNSPGPILIEDAYPDPQKCIALENDKVLIFSADINANTSPTDARCVIHDLATDKFSNTTFQYDGVDNTVVVTGPFDLNVVQVPGSQSIGSESGNVYIIPQEGFLLNGEPGSGTVPALDGPRCIVEFDPGANVTTRFTPTGADLTTTGFNKDDKLYIGSTLGVDGNVYAFPGEVKKDIFVLDPSNRTATQSTFGIFNTTGANTIQCQAEAITASDGYAYIRATGVQPDYFTGTQDFWLAIDTNPDSNTYQTGTCIPIDNDGIVTTEQLGKGLAIAKDGLIISHPQSSSPNICTLQINSNAGFAISYHPALLNNIND